jgi:uncharacterized membrane protein
MNFCMCQLPRLQMFPAATCRALLGYALNLEILAATGANIYFGMLSIPLKSYMSCMREEDTKLSFQVMLIHLISVTSHRFNIGRGYFSYQIYYSYKSNKFMF